MQTARVLFLLPTLAIGLVACHSPAAVLTPAQKIEKVEQMTRALSLTDNPGLKRATASLTQLSASLSQGAFTGVTRAMTGMVAAGGGNLISVGGGNMVAAGGGNYALRALSQGIRQDIFHLAGTATAPDGATVTYDDATHELTSVTGTDTAATFHFETGKEARTWTIDVKRSPDGTTGQAVVGVTAASWVQASGAEPLPYKILNDEVPGSEGVTAISISLDMRPGGGSDRVKLTASLDEREQTMLGLLPTHLVLDFEAPGLTAKTDTRLKGLDLASKGSLGLETDAGNERFGYGVALKLGENTGTFDLVHEAAGLRLGLVAAKGASPSTPILTTGLYDSQTGAKVADVTAADAPGTLKLDFPNGKTILWHYMDGVPTSPTP